MFNPEAQISDIDPELWRAMRAEWQRQEDHVELIASENYVSPQVMRVQGSVLTNKYAEGYPGKRYYGGCEHVDVAEQLAIDRARQLFGAEYANVQPHSGSQANAAVYMAMLQPGDTILGMSLAHGGHLTHGASVNFSGKIYKSVAYGLEADTELLDYAQVNELAAQHKPKMLVAGASAYSRVIDWQRLRDIADQHGAYLLVDMAHYAGLIAAGEYPNPVGIAHFVTSTTHKTLRGPRGGLILSSAEFEKPLNSMIFPGIQGGPLMHVIAGKALAFKEAMSPDFKRYQQQVKANARAMAEALTERGLRIVSGGTDSHLMLVDLRPKGVSGRDAEHALERADITCNKNGVPFDTAPFTITSGIRVGTPAGTTRGFGTAEFTRIGQLIGEVLDGFVAKDDSVEARVREEVRALTARFPIYS